MSTSNPYELARIAARNREVAGEKEPVKFDVAGSHLVLELLSKRLDALEGARDAHAHHFGEQGTRIASLESSKTEQASRIGSLETTTSSHESRITSLERRTG